MKKLLLYVLLFWVFWILFYSYVQFKQDEDQKKGNIKVAVGNFQKVDEYLEKNYKGNYPLPSWDLILLDKHNSLIHLEDRKTSLNNIKDLAIIQWTTCDILKNNKDFESINHDKRFSIIDKDWNLVHKRCFSYAVTKDRTKFQIWTIIKNNWNYKSYLLWNTKKSITRSYNSPMLAKDGSEDFLPYPAEKLSPVVILKNKQNSSVEVKVVPFDGKKYTIKLKEWNNIILSWNSSSYDIEIVWELADNSNLKFIDTNGSIIYIHPQENSSKVDFKIKDYSIDTKKINYFVETWRFLASIVKLWDDKDMEVKKDGVTLVIRWTKFTINAWKNTFDTFLNLWHIVQNIDWKTINLTLQNAFSIIKDNQIVKDIEKVKKLAGFTVFNDIKINPSYDMSMSTIWKNIASIITWAYDLKKYKLSYKNWQDIGLIIFDNSLNFKDYIKANKKFLWIDGDITREIDFYNNIVNQICGSYNLWTWLDITKLHYILKNQTNKLNWFSLKSSIRSKLWLTKNNYVLFTSRKYNWQYSSRLVYNSLTNTIDSYNLARLSLFSSIKQTIFACDMK